MKHDLEDHGTTLVNQEWNTHVCYTFYSKQFIIGLRRPDNELSVKNTSLFFINTNFYFFINVPRMHSIQLIQKRFSLIY